jgi:hypothetical protein
MTSSDTRPLLGRRTLPWRTQLDLPAPPPAAPPHAAPRAPGLDLGIECCLVEEPDPIAATRAHRPVYEVWTRHRVYLLDARLTCLAVTSRASGAREAAPRCEGARLVGGRRREGAVLELWRPVPAPGSMAIFAPPGGPSQESVVTSEVERVVLRQTVTRLSLGARATAAPAGPGPGLG